MVSTIREKEEELLLWEDNLNKKKQEMEVFNSSIKAKEDELLYQKNALIEQEKNDRGTSCSKTKER